MTERTGSAPQTETNRDIVRHAFEAWRQGTAPITDVFAPQMVWRIEGHSVASREYGDRQAFVDEVWRRSVHGSPLARPSAPPSFARFTPPATP